VGGGGEVIAGEGVHQRRRSRDRECPDDARPVPPGLAEANVAICREPVPRLVEVAPSAIFLFVANPVDVVTYATLRISGLPRS
jgi:lactate/malate dehydrogenase, NAD binding domain